MREHERKEDKKAERTEAKLDGREMRKAEDW